jgi:hypothetical protein
MLEQDLDKLLGYLRLLKEAHAVTLRGEDVILCQITRQAGADEYSVRPHR